MVNISQSHYLTLIFTIAVMAVSMIVTAIRNDFGTISFVLPGMVLVTALFSAAFALTPDEEPK